MTLEAAEEMNRICVINWLNKVYVSPSQAFDEYSEEEWRMFARDALVLLLKNPTGEWLPVDEENDAWDCSLCGAMVGRKTNYCPRCGRRMRNTTN